MTKEDITKRNNILIRGNSTGKTVLFANGYGCDYSMWRYIYPELEKDFRVVLFDHIGSGRSDASQYSFEKYNSLDGYAEDIIQIIDTLEFGKVHLVAHSVSCMIGALASIRRPELFQSLVMIGPSPCYINQEDGYFGGFSREDLDGLIEALDNNYLGWVSTVTPVIMGNPERPELTEELTNIFCRNNPEIAKHFAKVTFYSDNRKDLGRVSVKTYIIQSEVDSIAPTEVGKYVTMHIKGSEFFLIPANGHCPHLSHPKETLEVLKKILY